jgi:O-antigen/teichoic acid export membrane protein
MSAPKASSPVVLGLSCVAAATLIGCSLIQRATKPGPSVRVILALIPMIPVSMMGRSIVIAIRNLDELQRRIVLEAIFGAFLTGAFLTLLYGQLQHARVGLPELNWAFVWAAMAGPSAVACLVAARRYQ